MPLVDASVVGIEMALFLPVLALSLWLLEGYWPNLSSLSRLLWLTQKGRFKHKKTGHHKLLIELASRLTDSTLLVPK